MDLEFRCTSRFLGRVARNMNQPRGALRRRRPPLLRGGGGTDVLGSLVYRCRRVRRVDGGWKREVRRA